MIYVGVRKGSHGAGRLAFPGGHLELGESWETCAIREVKEETNLDISQPCFVGATNDCAIDQNPNKHYVTLFMESNVLTTSDPLKTMEPHKCEEWVWKTWDELRTIYRDEQAKLFDPIVHFLEKYPNYK